MCVGIQGFSMKLALTVSIALSLQAAAQPGVGYHIGNSLTWDCQPEMIELLIAEQNESLSTGFHINCNHSLDQIVGDPSQTCVIPVPEFGTFQNALTQVDLDYITVQPYWTETSTLSTDQVVIQYFDSLLSANPENEDTVLYLYQAWGARWFMRDGHWYDPIDTTGTIPTTPENHYFEMLFQSIDQSLDRPVRLIPAAQVLLEIQDRILNDELPGVISLIPFYRDDIHMSEELGRFTAAITVATVLYDRPPFGMFSEWIQERGDGGYSIDVYRQIEYAVWDVVSSEPRSGVNPCLADTNRDGMLTPQDFTAWLAAYNTGSSIADQNRDGRISPRDYTVWIDSFNNGCP